MNETRLLGIAGWSGAGKTTLLTQLLPLLAATNLRVATVKHAHHEFEIDVPGKDSYRHRAAGAEQVLVASSQRWAHIRELKGAREPALHELLMQLAPCDLILVEGYKKERHPKLEVFRAAVGKSALYHDDADVIAVLTDDPLPAPHPPRLALSNIPALAEAIWRLAKPLPEVLAKLQGL
jgi:molybdopterin-guanine dinucleotide biosynthesis adapter protein